jgi:hypothetical protein
MTAPDPLAEATKKLLPTGGRPYMSAGEGEAGVRFDGSEQPDVTHIRHAPNPQCSPARLRNGAPAWLTQVSLPAWRGSKEGGGEP